MVKLPKDYGQTYQSIYFSPQNNISQSELQLHHVTVKNHRHSLCTTPVTISSILKSTTMIPNGATLVIIKMTPTFILILMTGDSKPQVGFRKLLTSQAMLIVNLCVTFDLIM